TLPRENPVAGQASDGVVPSEERSRLLRHRAAHAGHEGRGTGSRRWLGVVTDEAEQAPLGRRARLHEGVRAVLGMVGVAAGPLSTRSGQSLTRIDVAVPRFLGAVSRVLIEEALLQTRVPQRQDLTDRELRAVRIVRSAGLALLQLLADRLDHLGIGIR